MAAANCTAFAVYGQAFRIRITFYNVTTGLPISGSLTVLAATISKDDGSSVSTTNAPVQSGTLGTCYIDLTATEMTCHGCTVYATCSNPNAFSKVKEIAPVQLGIIGGGIGANQWWQQSILLLEQVMVQSNAYLYNANSTVGAAQTVLNRDGSTLASGTLQSTQNGTIRSQTT
jgi:hypothetical protein